VCKGARYNRDTLEITFKGKNIAQVLDMPVSEALDFFSNQPNIARYMQTLVDVGLGYVRLGQSAPTLSGGEAQRVKLASELAKRSTGHTLYLLDEPTTGLHFEDVRRLLTVLSRLVDQGNSVLVIEHNLDVIKTADWIIDLGPEGGRGGGLVVAEGTPEKIARSAKSHTARFLAPLLELSESSETQTGKKSTTASKKVSSTMATSKAKTKAVSKATEKPRANASKSKTATSKQVLKKAPASGRARAVKK
jgi:excinuclease ABC subunit A